MLDTFKKTMDRNLLKYTAGRSIHCPCCKAIADYRDWVMLETHRGIMHRCGACAAQLFAKIHDDDPIAYMAEAHGWKVTTLITPAKMRRLIRAITHPAPAPKPYKFKLDRKDYRHYPAAIMPPLPIVTNDDGAWSNPISTAQYVADFCRLNHLTA